MEEEVERKLAGEIIGEDFATYSKDLEAVKKLKERILTANYQNNNGDYDWEARAKDKFEWESARLRFFVSYYRGPEPKKAAEVEKILRELEENVLPIAESMGYNAMYTVYKAGLVNGATTPREADIRREEPRHKQTWARKAVKYGIRSVAQALWSDPSRDDEWSSKVDKRIGSMAHYARSIITAWFEEDALNPEDREYAALYRRAIPKSIEDVKAILKEHPSVVPDWALRPGRPSSK